MIGIDMKVTSEEAVKGKQKLSGKEACKTSTSQNEK